MSTILSFVQIGPVMGRCSLKTDGGHDESNKQVLRKMA